MPDDDKRRRVFERAEAVFKEGAHFILGARAQLLKPDHRFGSGFAVWLNGADTSFTAPQICAAGSHSARGTEQICLGRVKHPDVARAGGTRIRAGDSRLRDYLLRADFERALGQAQSDWVPFSKSHGVALTPRTFFDGSKDVVVLGERCVGKRHVDCISLVNHCLSAVGKKKSFSIKQLIAGKGGKVVMDRAKGITGPRARNGDIVIKHENHIGICGVDASGKIVVIEATGGERAVIRTTFANTARLDADKWKWRVRPLL